MVDGGGKELRACHGHHPAPLKSPRGHDGSKKVKKTLDFLDPTPGPIRDRNGRKRNKSSHTACQNILPGGTAGRRSNSDRDRGTFQVRHVEKRTELM